MDAVSTGMQDLTWGGTVRVKSTASIPDRRLGALAEIVGIRKIETPAQASQFSAPISSKVYLIEFSDGDAVEVPEAWIEAASAGE